MEEITDIVTFGCDNYTIKGVMQRRNKLKGTAQQRLLITTMGSKDDLSIETLRKMFEDNISRLYIVESPLIINNYLYERKSDYIVYDKLPKIIEAKTRTKIIDRTIKICSNCGQKISAFAQRTRRCYHCMEGNFRFPDVKINYDKVIHPYDLKDRVLETLCRQGHIRQCSFLNKRLDFFRFHNGVFDIFESKNKENTGLTYSDYFRSLKYPIMVKQCGYNVKQLSIIYNGEWSTKLKDRFFKQAEQNVDFKPDEGISGRGHERKGGFMTTLRQEVIDTPLEKHGFDVEFIPIGKYLHDNGIFVERIVVSKSNGYYDYNIIDGKSDYITIDLSGINEEWNVD